MLSISDNSADIELLGYKEGIYPMLSNVLYRLLSGFRKCTQSQSSTSDGGTNSRALVGKIDSSHTGDTS
jgi:hypothetical protein